MSMITQEQYGEIKARLDVHEAWLDTLRKQTKCRKCKGTGRHYAHHTVTCRSWKKW